LPACEPGADISGLSAERSAAARCPALGAEGIAHSGARVAAGVVGNVVAAVSGAAELHVGGKAASVEGIEIGSGNDSARPGFPPPGADIEHA
jgi:hypothetical protein